MLFGHRTKDRYRRNERKKGKLNEPQHKGFHDVSVSMLDSNHVGHTNVMMVDIVMW